MHYEVQTGSFVVLKDLVDHAATEKENIGNVSSVILGKAVNELFLDEVNKCRLRIDKVRVWGFMGLRKKEPGTSTISIQSFEEEWKVLNTRLLEIEDEVGSKWTVKSENNKTTFLHFEDVRYNSQVAVSEVTVKKNNVEKKIDYTIKYHEKSVPDDKICSLLKPLKACDIIVRTVTLIKIIERSYVCQGFEMDEYESLYGVAIKRNRVSTLHYDDDDESRNEICHSPGCHVLTNAGGAICSVCQNTKYNANKKRKRSMMNRLELSSLTNHRLV